MVQSNPVDLNSFVLHSPFDHKLQAVGILRVIVEGYFFCAWAFYNVFCLLSKENTGIFVGFVIDEDSPEDIMDVFGDAEADTDTYED